MNHSRRTPVQSQIAGDQVAVDLRHHQLRGSGARTSLTADDNVEVEGIQRQFLHRQSIVDQLHPGGQSEGSDAAIDADPHILAGDGVGEPGLGDGEHCGHVESEFGRSRRAESQEEDYDYEQTDSPRSLFHK